jgi:hypothetical protein
LDNLIKSLRSKGIGSSSSPEYLMKRRRSSGVFSTTTHKGLLRAAFYYCGKCFFLRGGMEHRNLALSQLERLQEPDRYVYRENFSKNKQGGIRQLKLEHKLVTMFANPSVKEKCPVNILDIIYKLIAFRN